MRVDELKSWEAFLAVAKHGNFSKAAATLKLTPSQLSKRIAKLEDVMGVRLFQRSTRVVSLTDEGRSLAPRIETILADLESVESSFSGSRGMSGKVRVTSAPFVAHRLLQPVLSEFMSAYPNIHIELELSKAFVNLIESGFDIAIRVETPKDSDLVYRKLAANHLVLCASPHYLKKRKRPVTQPNDLAHHDLLMLSIHNRCKFEGSSLQLSDFNRSKRITCENGVFLTEMALNGGGILVRSIWDVQEHLTNGTLVQVLANHPLETFGHIYAVIPSKRYLAPRVRVLLDFIVKQAASWKY